MTGQRPTSDPRRLVWAVCALRRGTLFKLGELAHVKQQLRWIRKRRTQFAPHHANLDAIEERLNYWLENIGGFLSEMGRALLDLGGQIDEHFSPDQRMDLLSCRHRCDLVDAPFLTLIGASMESPTDSKGRQQAGPLFVLLAGTPGDDCSRAEPAA
jgi:hypothetical protein